MASFPVINGVTTFLTPPEGYDVDFDNPKSRHVLDQYLIFALLGSFAFFCLPKLTTVCTNRGARLFEKISLRPNAGLLDRSHHHSMDHIFSDAGCTNL